MTSAQRQGAYGILAAAGLALPWTFNLQFMTGPERGIAAFVAACFVNPAASSIAVDVLIAATAFAVWAVVEARRIGMRHVWVYLVLTPTVAFACAFPLFLLFRERHLAAQPASP